MILRPRMPPIAPHQLTPNLRLQPFPESRQKCIREGGVLGSVLGEPDGAEKYNIRVEVMMAVPDASRLYELADDAARQEFSIPIAKTMKLEQIQEAHRIAEGGGAGGKIIIVP